MSKTVEMNKQILLQMLQDMDYLSVSNIAQRLNISLPSARRLCVKLSEEGSVLRVHGGIKPLVKASETYSFDQLKNEHVEEKIRIGRYASSLVTSNQVIFIEAGTTLSHFSMALAERLRNRELSNIVVFTNSLINLNILHPVKSDIVLIGGQYREDRKDFVGYISEMVLKNLQFNSCFIGADAISPTAGVMAMDMATVHFDAELCNHSENVHILAHSQKFYRNSLLSYVPVSKVHTLITDHDLQADTLQEYRRLNVNIVTV